MRIVTPSVLLALACLASCVYFVVRGCAALRETPASLDSMSGELPRPWRFAGTRFPLERSDRLPLLLITLIYALTAFWALGDLEAPQGVWDFGGGETVSLALPRPVYVTGLRFFSGLGTGNYRVEISDDGENWSTLWQRREDPSDPGKTTGWYWADAQGYVPAYALDQPYNQLYKWRDIRPENPQNARFLRITGRADRNVL